MKLKQGYYGFLDMLLSFREIYMGERFKPYCTQLLDLMAKLEKEELKSINDIGDENNGYLDTIEKAIDITLKNNVIIEELFLKLIKNPALVLNDCNNNLSNINFLIFMWQKYFNIEISKNHKQLVEKVFHIDKKVNEKGLFKYLQSITDRFDICNDIISFHIKPDLEVEIKSIENIIIMPSLYACRNFTFWYNNSDFIFYIGLDSQQITPTDPSDMLLLKTSAFNDKTRLKILKLLTNKSMSANEIAQILKVNASTVSRHLKIFKDTNFVDIQAREGNSIYYYLDEVKVKQALEDINNFILGGIK
ncbi:metalloregulator ArsR/SmtB family transcription factor [Clostridiaceae bacterium M8S5]|nr:metalloregulator ArsR/SmtB family transcription factor [Clostridiaceae bacterium M8S5]